MDRSWTTRDYQTGDENGITNLWKLVFKKGEQERGVLEYWYWQFRDNPAGAGKIRLAVDAGQIVGQYAVIPMEICFQGKPALATLSLDTMTHPDYRRQGMFERLANELYADLREYDISITYGFPNDNSLGGFIKKLEWVHICSLPVYVKPLRPGVIIDRVVTNRLLVRAIKPLANLGESVVFRPRKPSKKSGQCLGWLESFDSRAEVLWDQVYDPDKIAVKRSTAYLNWRYFQNPARGYQAVAYQEKGDLVGYAVLRCMLQFGLRGGMITEFIVTPGHEAAAQALLEAAIQYFNGQDMDLVACLAYGDPSLTALLKRNRFFLPPSQMAFKEWYFGGRVNNAGVDPTLVKDPANWYLTFGDTDII